MAKRNMFCAACGSTELSVYFPTPEPVARLVIEMADIHSGLAVLEPSAGTGHIARLAAETGAHVDCMEIQSHMADQLRQSGLYRNVWDSNFRHRDPVPIYDRIVMNPPFETGADMDHVEHAIGFLVRGGVLVAVMSAMAGERNRRRDKAFAAILERHGAERTPLPKDAFKEAGTNVASVLVRLQRAV